MSAWSMSIRSLKRRRLRTALTVLSVVAGVTMMVFLVSLAQGMETQLNDAIRLNGGADLMVVNATTPPVDPHNPVIVPSGVISESDAEALGNISGVYMVTSGLSANGLVNETQCTITGIEPDKFEIINGAQNIIAGRVLQVSDNNGVVLGRTLSDRLEASIGDSVLIETALNKSQYFTVIGIFETGSSAMNTRLYIHLDTAQNISEENGQVSTIGVKCTTPDVVDYVASMIPNQVPGVRVIVQQAVVEQAAQVRNTMSVFVGAIGVVALVAGSFGVINTTMMSMFERTREIGILKAVGATNSKILTMFWTEAFVIGLLGGGVGCLTGLALASVIPLMSGHMGGMSITVLVTPTGLGAAFAIGLIVCIIGGLYPAWRASKMKTVEALRHE